MDVDEEIIGVVVHLTAAVHGLGVEGVEPPVEDVKGGDVRGGAGVAGLLGKVENGTKGEGIGTAVDGVVGGVPGERKDGA